MKHKFPVLMSPRGRMTGATELAAEKGSKEANAELKPAIFPFLTLFIGKGARGAEGLVFWLTSADQDFGRGRGAGGVGLFGDAGAGDTTGGVVVVLGDMSCLGNAG